MRSPFAFRLGLLALSISAAFAASAQTAQRPEVVSAAQQLEQKVMDWRRDFHQHP